MGRATQRAISSARYAESHEALAGLSDSAFRAARRTGNDPVSLTTIATTIGGYRARIASARRWLEEHHPVDADRYRRAVIQVEADVSAKLARALEPDERVGAERTADGSYDPAPETLRTIRLWGIVARNRTGLRRILAATARRQLDRDLPAGHQGP